jgi:hypothetical protein
MKLSEILTSIGVIIAIVLSVVNMYNTYFVEDTPYLTLQSFPYEVSTLHVDENIEFTFFLYNEGEKPAFVDYIYIGDSNVIIEPKEDFVVHPYDSTSVTVILPKQTGATTEEIQLDIYFGPGNQKISSDLILAQWGTL